MDPQHASLDGSDAGRSQSLGPPPHAARASAKGSSGNGCAAPPRCSPLGLGNPGGGGSDPARGGEGEAGGARGGAALYAALAPRGRAAAGSPRRAWAFLPNSARAIAALVALEAAAWVAGAVLSGALVSRVWAVGGWVGRTLCAWALQQRTL